MTYKRIKEIADLASQILKLTNNYELPINPEQVAEQRGLKVVEYEFGDDISGILLIKGGNKTIGYNKHHSSVRQRFTIAHELGHHELNHQRGGVFIDRYNRHFKAIPRDQNTSTGDDYQEVEANSFAAALLMPEELLREELKKELQRNPMDLSGDDINGEQDLITNLSKKFNVSKQAMTFRISNLGLLFYL